MSRKSKKTPDSAVEFPLLNGLACPTISDDYAWLDYYELSCLLLKDQRLSKGAIVEDLDTVKGTTPQLLFSASNADQFFDDEDGDSDGMEDDDLPMSVGGDERKDALIGKNESLARDLFFGFSVRQRIFGDWYPFEVVGDANDELKVRDLNDKRKVYIQMLLSAGLRMVPQQRWKDLTEPFEEISHKVFEILMPKGWEVHRFGAKGVVRYKGRLIAKLKALAVDIKAEFVGKPHYYKPTNSGDGGLDLVAWHPLGDFRSGIPAALAQCGCTLDGWPNKSLEASPARLKNSLRPLVPWLTYYFMPHDLLVEKAGQQDWQRGNDITESILIDRYRIIKIFESHDVDAAKVYNPSVLDDFTQRHQATK